MRGGLRVHDVCVREVCVCGCTRSVCGRGVGVRVCEVCVNLARLDQRLCRLGI